MRSEVKTGAQILVRCLNAQGVGVVFGIPGSLTREIDAALYASRDVVQYISARHEGGASLMAEGYARVTGDVGVCMTIPGPGAANAYVGILEAFTANVPLLLITAQNYSRFQGRDQAKVFHGLDQLAAFAPVTKCMKRVESAAQIPEAVHAIFGELRSGRPQPALLEITRDALAQEADVAIPHRHDGTREGAQPNQIDQIVNLLGRSKRPFVLAGRGVCHCRASKELVQFAARIGAPVATTKLGKGVVSEAEPLSLGTLDHEVARAALAKCDLLLAIGVRFTQADTDNWEMTIRQPLIHIDADAGQIGAEYPADVGIATDIKLTLRQLLDALAEHCYTNGWGQQVAAYKQKLSSEKKSRYLMMLRDALPCDAIVSVDVHMLGYAACTDFQVYEANRFLHSPISMTMGYALPAAIGARVACPDSPVVALCGDGGFLLSSPEFATAVKYNLPIVVIVANDDTFGTIKDVQLRHCGHTVGVELRNPDLIKFAHAFGVPALRTTNLSGLRSALRTALASHRLFLLEFTPQKTPKARIVRPVKQAMKRLRPSAIRPSAAAKTTGG